MGPPIGPFGNAHKFEMSADLVKRRLNPLIDPVGRPNNIAPRLNPIG